MNNKMDCKQILQMLAGDYLDNELDPATRGHVDRHLVQCSACRQVSERLLSITRPLRQAPKINPPPEVWSRIRTEVSRFQGHHAGHKKTGSNNILEIFLMRPVFAAAAAAAILVIVSVAFFMNTAQKPGTMAGTVNGASAAVELNALTGNIEIRNQHAGFGSCLEQLLV